MKTLRCIVLVPSLLVALAAAAPLGGALAQEAPAAPKAVVPQTLVDLGIVPRGDRASTEFTLENRGTAPLVVTQTTSSCSCMVVRADSPIAPGGSGKVVAEVDTEVLEGPSVASVTVYTNDAENPILTLKVNLESRPYLVARPGYFRYSVYQGFDEDATIGHTVAATDPADFTIERVESTLPSLSVTFREAAPEERMAGFPGPQYRVAGTLAPDAPVGALTGFVRVHTTHDEQKMFSIPISGFVRPVVAVTPPRVELGTFRMPDDEKQEGYGASLRIQHFLADEGDLEITRIETDVPHLKTRLNEGKTGRDWYLDAWFPRDTPQGKYDGTIKLFTTSEITPLVEVPVSGEHAG
ncbi:MAG TPA: DUF1573 domain-containing protein [Thermoanaerobaculia bacterium]|nr:DUF1573 domain-containing protein [Thermoanaerobaculia bacterium]